MARCSSASATLAPAPEPFAAMLTELAANHANMNTAANPARLWLLPGGCAGQPRAPGALVQQFRVPGAAAAQTCTAAFGQLVRQPPAPVVTHALGYSPGTATCHVIAAGGTWHRYPATRAGSTETARRHAGSDSLSGEPGTTDRKDVADEAANVIT